MVDSAQNMGAWTDVWMLNWWMCYQSSLWHYRNFVLGTLPRVLRLVHKIRRDNIALVYTNTATVFEGALAARLVGVPHIWHIHEVMAPKHLKPLMFSLEQIGRWINKWSDRIIFESNTSRLLGEKWIDPQKTLTVYNSVRFNDKGPLDRKNSCMKFGLRDNQTVISWIGRLSERKNPMMLLKAIQEMKHAKNVQFLIVGEGPLEQSVRNMIQQLDIESHCKIVPFQNDVRPVLAASDIFVLTSYEESFGLVLVEAGFFELPVVSTKTQGPNEIVVDHRTGYLVDVNDSLALAEKLDYLITHPGERKQMGLAGASRVRDYFTPEANTKKIEQVIDQLICAKSAGKNKQVEI